MAVLVPSVCLLWFMNQAVQNERVAVRQKLLEAYRGHLALLQERLENHLTQTSTNLDNFADTLLPAALFAKEVREGVADAVICYNADGDVTYPAPGTIAGNAIEFSEPTLAAQWSEAHSLESTAPAEAAEAYGRLAAQTTNNTLAGRALQAQVRLLFHSNRPGDFETAIR